MVELKHLIGQRIQQLREKLHLTQEELGAKAEIGNGYIGQLERGIKAASIKTLKKIADVMGVPVKFFFQDEKDILKLSEKESTLRELLGLVRNRPKEQIKLISNITKSVFKELDRKKKK